MTPGRPAGKPELRGVLEENEQQQQEEVIEEEEKEVPLVPHLRL